MAYNAVPTVATGDLWTAANHNTYIRDNFAASVPDIFEAEGDLAIASDVDTAVRLAVGASGKYLGSDGTRPVWKDLQLAKKRQGGSATDWSVYGTTAFDVPSSAKVQIGVARVTRGTPVTIYFPESYTKLPIVIAGSYKYVGTIYEVDTPITYLATNCFIVSIMPATGDATSVDVPWLAIGE